MEIVKAIKINNRIEVFNEIPVFFNNTPHYNTLPNSRFIEDGWQDLQVPLVDNSYQKISEVKEDDDGFFYYEVIELNSSELLELQNQEYSDTLNNLNAVVSSARLYAKAVAMNKTLQHDLDYFEDVYTSKYNMCQVTTFDDLLDFERIAEGYDSLEVYKAYVIERFEEGQSFFEQVKAIMEVFRKIVLQHIKNAEIDKANEKIQALNDLPIDLSPQDFSAHFESIIAL